MAAKIELLLQRIRYFGTSSRNQYGVEGACFRPTGGTVADPDIDILVAEVGKALPGDFGEPCMATSRTAISGWRRDMSEMASTPLAVAPTMVKSGAAAMMSCKPLRSNG